MHESTGHGMGSDRTKRPASGLKQTPCTNSLLGSGPCHLHSFHSPQIETIVFRLRLIFFLLISFNSDRTTDPKFGNVFDGKRRKNGDGLNLNYSPFGKTDSAYIRNMVIFFCADEQRSPDTRDISACHMGCERSQYENNVGQPR